MEFKTRELYPDELRVLKTLKTGTEKKYATKLKSRHYFILALFMGIFFAYLASLTNEDSFWFFICGTIAVFSFVAVVVMPYETYKKEKKNKDFLQRLNELIEKQMVDTCNINTTRIALVKEYKDEGDWYIVELCKDKVLYLFDSEYNLHKKFPCLQFEIYESRFFELTGRQIYPLSEKIKPVMIIQKNRKRWEYMPDIDTSEQLPGAPEFVLTENKNFDELINIIET
jgi:hypothetical protein